MKNRIIAIICVFMMLSQQVYASVLGTDIYGWSHDIGIGTKIYKNAFMSEQDGVGRQVEYYAEYTPNKSVVPTIISGKEMWGMEKITDAENYMKENGIVPLIGINASYFSLKTGIPMGHVISDRKIISKDTETYQTIGFMPDGSAFIEPLSIKTTLYFGENEVDIAHINKFNQEFMDIINLYTPEFAEHNHNDFASLNIILGNIDGELAIGEELTATVEEKFNYQGSLKIPEDKMILTVNEIAKPELYESLMMLEVGDEITISSIADGSSEWGKVESALGSVGDTLIEDGEILSDFETGTAPRTAVGITEDGKVIFYVIDGRQKPYSYGAKVETLANRMKELGCVDAINLDGGGSTIISGVYPGSDESTIFNSPSDGRPRGVANFIFLKNTKQATNKIDKLYLYPFEEHYLSGYKEVLTAKAVDSEYYPVGTPEKLKFNINGTESYIDSNGVLTAIGDGNFTVNVSGNSVSGKANYAVYKTPTNIDVYDCVSKKIISDLSLKKDDQIELSLKAQYNNLELKSTFECFSVVFPEELGYIDGNKLIITADSGEGKLLVSAGEYTKEINVKITRENPFYDTDFHWAKDMIKGVYEKGIVNGVVLDEKLMFLPDNNITREEFAVIVCKYLGIDVNQIEEYDLSMFSDVELISDWAKPYVAACVNAGALNGKTDGENVNFAPKDTLTRAETMTVLGRILEEDEAEYEELTFSDSQDIPEWAKEYVIKMVNTGFVTGYEDGTLKPDGNVLRAEAATIIFKMTEQN
ncbi:MAG: phosphodiester glycosidase family protein [Clostridia bacterium]|nr:phosphodiester glycosidase family protein [Clostridia bacterium]